MLQKHRLLISIFLLLFVVKKNYAQQKKYLNFDKNWQLSTSQNSQYYFCECYILPNGGFDGAFVCYLKNNLDLMVKKYTFNQNILNGEVVEFYDDGSPKLKAQYKQGQAIGRWQEWSKTGELTVDKFFDENSKIISDKNKKQLSEYEKMYFGVKEFEAPVYGSKCLLEKIDKEKYLCSDSQMVAYYQVPPIPPWYKTDPNFAHKVISVKLKYLLSRKGKVKEVEILESSGDVFLDDLAETHILNMIPFEAAKEFGNPIDFWIDAVVVFRF